MRNKNIISRVSVQLGGIIPELRITEGNYYLGYAEWDGEYRTGNTCPWLTLEMAHPADNSAAGDAFAVIRIRPDPLSMVALRKKDADSEMEIHLHGIQGVRPEAWQLWTPQTDARCNPKPEWRSNIVYVDERFTRFILWVRVAYKDPQTLQKGERWYIQMTSPPDPDSRIHW